MLYRKARLQRGRRSERGVISIWVVTMTMILTLASMLFVRIGQVSEEVDEERHLVDLHGKLVGKMAVNYGLDDACGGGQLTGLASRLSRQVEGELDERGQGRNFRCNVESELIERRNGPEEYQGTFRVMRVRSSANLDTGQGALLSPQDPSQQNRHREDEVTVEVREEQGDVERRRAKLVFVLDYSGSMRGNRISQLKSAVGHFVSQRYPMDYGVILFSSDIIGTSGIGSGPGHDGTVLAFVNSRDAGGGTQFNGPLQQAARELRRQEGQDLFIILLSDGQPGDGARAQSFVNNSIRGVPRATCEGRNNNHKCITIYTLGVDNANLSTLRGLSGNVLNPGAREYNYDASANQVSRAFDHIISNILCRYGPLDPGPKRDEEETLNVFLNERPLRRRDYSYDRRSKQLQFYDAACDQILNGGGGIIIRYGEPRIYME